MQVYLDHSATTPLHREVRAAMEEVASRWGNSSSLHIWGERSLNVIERSRQMVMNLLGAVGGRVVFTSGGTESNNLAIFGITRQYLTPQHLITSTVEHAAVAEPICWLEQHGWAVTRLPVDARGQIAPQDLQLSLRPNTVLVSLIYAHNEVGTVQNLTKLGQICRAAGVCFHTDAVQAVGRMPVDVSRCPVDLLSFSAHKFYGPQGIGGLYVAEGVSLVPLHFGGGQEDGLRSGTPAVPLIAGLGQAASLAKDMMLQEGDRLRALRDHLRQQLADLPELQPTGDWQDRLPHHLSFCHRTLAGRRLVWAMNLAGIAISSGSACSSGRTKPSPTLLAMGYPPEIASGGIRLSLGYDTTAADVDWAALALKQAIARLQLGD
ncbi:MAG: cysteine desulfurase [Oscillatoriales cyanobacterium SM2_2_1]|nr:cysteine desulfurase [Oscillatoriales cyanobacterium SM2_2_1]